MGPIGKFADSDGAFARANPAARVGLVGMGASAQFIRVTDLIIVRISVRAVDDVAGPAQAEAVGAVVERIETVVDLPSVGQTVAVGVHL